MDKLTIVISLYAIFMKQRDKLEFAEGKKGIEQLCHSEPVRTLVWESPSNSKRHTVIQSVQISRVTVSIHEKWYV